VVIGGDLFDGDGKDMGTGLYFARAIGRLAQADVPFLLLSGNHDAASVLTRSIPWPDNVKLFGTRRPETHVLAECAVAVHGQSFATPAVTDNLVLVYPDAVEHYLNIGVLHTALARHQGHAAYAPCNLEVLRSKHYDYWALGHVQEHEVVSEDPYVVFPGNTQGRTIRETGPKARGDSDGGERPDRHHRAYRTGRTALGACRGRLHRVGGGRGGLAHTRIAPLHLAGRCSRPASRRTSVTHRRDGGHRRTTRRSVIDLRQRARGRRVDIAGPVHRKGEGAMPCKQRPIIPQMICHTPITELFIRLFGPVLSHKPVTTPNCLNNL